MQRAAHRGGALLVDDGLVHLVVRGRHVGRHLHEQGRRRVVLDPAELAQRRLDLDAHVDRVVALELVDEHAVGRADPRAVVHAIAVESAAGGVGRGAQVEFAAVIGELGGIRSVDSQPQVGEG